MLCLCRTTVFCAIYCVIEKADLGKSGACNFFCCLLCIESSSSFVENCEANAESD